MYRLLWNVLPGDLSAKVVQIAVIALAVLALLFVVVFPFIADTFLVEQSTIE
jgi:hypothetical protein